MRHQPQPGLSLAATPATRADRGDPAAAAPPLPLHPPPVLDWAAGIDEAAAARSDELDDIVQAERRHLRLLRRHGPDATYDAVLTGLLFCAHLWTNQPADDRDVWRYCPRRAEPLIPVGAEATTFSASRLFAAVYPEAVSLAAVIAAHPWRCLADDDVDQRQRFVTEIGLRLGRPHYQLPEHGDVVAHWMKFDSAQPSEPTRQDVPGHARARLG